MTEPQMRGHGPYRNPAPSCAGLPGRRFAECAVQGKVGHRPPQFLGWVPGTVSERPAKAPAALGHVGSNPTPSATEA